MRAFDALDDLEDDADDVGTNFRDIGREADSFGAAVGKIYEALRPKRPIAFQTIKAGFGLPPNCSQKFFRLLPAR